MYNILTEIQISASHLCLAVQPTRHYVRVVHHFWWQNRDELMILQFFNRIKTQILIQCRLIQKICKNVELLSSDILFKHIFRYSNSSSGQCQILEKNSSGRYMTIINYFSIIIFTYIYYFQFSVFYPVIDYFSVVELFLVDIIFQT